MSQSMFGIMIYIFLHYAFDPFCAERSSSNVSRRDLPGANPICLLLLFLLSTTVTVTMFSILWRGEGVINSFSSNDLITNVNISFCRVGTDQQNNVFIAFLNSTVFVGTADAKWFLLVMTGHFSQKCGDYLHTIKVIILRSYVS